MVRNSLRFNASQFARRSRLDPRDALEQIREHYDGAGTWGYWYARGAVYDLRAGVPANAVMAGCDRIKHPTGQRQNRDVLELASGMIAPITSKLFSIEKRWIPIRGEDGLWLQPRGYFVQNRMPTIFWCQPCRNYSFDRSAFRIYNALLIDRFVRTGEFEAIDSEVYDFQADPITNLRHAKIVNLLDAPPISRDELIERLRIFLEAHEKFVSSGGPTKKKFVAIKPPAERGLFD